MCGIFAYYGPKEQAAEIVLKGLKKLEYRGYDSWGIAMKPALNEQKNGSLESSASSQPIQIEKHTGKISEVITLKDELTVKSHMAFGHSRWATHGGVTDYNAHPHTTENKEIAICHNGIFENYLELKNDLIDKGHQFRSDTDSEVFAHMIEEEMKAGIDFETGFVKAIKKMHGRYGVMAMHQDENKIIAARRGSPLIIGKADDGSYFIASDVPAFLEYSKDVIYLDDEQMVVIDENGAKFYDIESHEPIEKRVISIDWEIEEADKGDYPHFMIKEIMDQKETLARTLNTNREELLNLAEAIKKAYGTYLVGCGTAGIVAHIGEYLFADIAKRHINIKNGSEFASARHFLTDRSLVLAISQSGETADTLEAFEIATEKGADLGCIVNVETSTMARLSKYVLPLKVGVEKAVASTKATTAQVALLTLLAFAVDDRLEEGRKVLIEAAAQVNDMLNPRYEAHIESVAAEIMNVSDIMVIGRGVNYPVAMESALKLKEISYIHAEGFAGGELKHGHIALIEEGTPCIVMVSNDEYKAEILSNAMEVKARGGLIIGVAPENAEVFDHWIKVPDTKEASAITNIIPVQILAYKLGVMRQNNPDMPRNLAKSVTVK